MCSPAPAVDQAMTGNSRVFAPAVLQAYDFGRFETIVDVGGGQGAFLAVILARHAARFPFQCS